MKVGAFTLPRETDIEVHLLRLGLKEFFPILVQRNHIAIDLAIVTARDTFLGFNHLSAHFFHYFMSKCER